MMLTGSVPPVVVKPGILEKIWMLFESVPMAVFSCFIMNENRIMTPSNLPWLRETEQEFRM